LAFFKNMPFRIGLDISGGDNAPAEVYKGAVLAHKELEHELTLVGVPSEIEDQAAKYPGSLKAFKVVEALEKIEMADSPVTAVRRKRNSSMVVGVNLVKAGKLDAFVSCGNTGALMCAATLITGMIPGVERPGIAVPMPTKKGPCLMIDVGANIDCSPQHLLQYAVMAAVYSRLVMGKSDPRVGILNIGEEESKGTELYKTTYKLLAATRLNFVGNIDAKSIFSGDCDCIVCDGLVGNIALKVAEGCADFIMKSFIGAGSKNVVGMLGLALMKGNLLEFKKNLDYAEYGGAILLGIDGIVIKGHGRSNALAVKNALKVAAQELSQHLTDEIKKSIDETYGDPAVRELLGDSR